MGLQYANMPLVLGARIAVTFYTYSGDSPPLYYDATEGTLTLASVNAGNSEGLCVGLGPLPSHLRVGPDACPLTWLRL
jgi:hypothetical protein